MPTLADFMLHRALGGDVVNELADGWTPELCAKVNALVVDEGFAPDPDAADALVARLGTATVMRLRAEISPEALAILHDAVSASRSRDLHATVRAALGIAAAFVFMTVTLGAFWWRTGQYPAAFLLASAITVPVVGFTAKVVRRRRALMGRGVRSF